MPVRIVGIDHVVLLVRDMEAALRFYRDVLGCAVERTVQEIGLVQLRAGASLIDLVPARPAAGSDRNLGHLALKLAEFDEVRLREHLLGHGVVPGEVALRYGAEGEGPSMYVADPDGNLVELKGPADHGRACPDA